MVEFEKLLFMFLDNDQSDLVLLEFERSAHLLLMKARLTFRSTTLARFRALVKFLWLVGEGLERMVRYALSLMAKAAEQERSNHGWLVRVLRDDGMQLSIPAKMTSATLSAQSEAPRPEKQTALQGNCW